MFRVKIALLSACVSGLVLVGCGFYFLSVISAISLDRIDREINALGESQLHVWHSKKHWEDFEGSLRSIYGPENWKDLVVSVTDADHQVLYRSPHWPPGISVAAFPAFDGRMEKGPRPAPPAGDRPPAERGGLQRAVPEPGDRPQRDMRPAPPVGGREREGRPFESGSPPQPAVRIKMPEFRTFSGPAGTWRVGAMGNQHVTIILGVNLAGYNSDADRFKKAFFMFLPPALVILAAGGWLIAQRALRPVAGITNTAQRITARGLDQRVPEGKADSELLNLIRTINTMLDRLERSFNQAVRFSADAAHELQTPLSVLQGMLDDAVRQCPGEGEEQRRYASLLEEVQRLKAIVQKLLILARADASQLPLRREPVDFSELIHNAVDDATALKPDARVEAHIAPGVILQGDRDLLGLVVQELTKNAVKYNRESGVIRYELATESAFARLTVENSSDPIPVEDRERIFERFHRIDKSRSVRIPGTGLGLSLAREITRAHRGTLRLDPAKPGLVGFSLRLPLQ